MKNLKPIVLLSFLFFTSVISNDFSQPLVDKNEIADFDDSEDFDFDNIDDLDNKISSILNNYNDYIYIANNIYKKCMENYTIEHFIQKYITNTLTNTITTTNPITTTNTITTTNPITNNPVNYNLIQKNTIQTKINMKKMVFI